jgi:hypothetical protein
VKSKKDDVIFKNGLFTFETNLYNSTKANNTSEHTIKVKLHVTIGPISMIHATNGL